LRAGLLDGLLPQLEIALHRLVVPVRAALERLAALLPRSHLDEVATALGAGDAERNRLRVLAPGVAAAREKLAVASAADHHRLAALVADGVGRSRHRAVAVGPEVTRV